MSSPIQEPREIFVLTFHLISNSIAHHRGAFIKHHIGRVNIVHIFVIIPQVLLPLQQHLNKSVPATTVKLDQMIFKGCLTQTIPCFSDHKTHFAVCKAPKISCGS